MSFGKFDFNFPKFHVFSNFQIYIAKAFAKNSFRRLVIACDSSVKSFDLFLILLENCIACSKIVAAKL